MRQLKKDWIELWLKMAGGIATEFDKIRAMDTMEFWTIYDIWLDRIKDENSRRRQGSK
jgi:hypothetical protein